MSFWKNVSNELEFRGISRKELAFTVSANVATINRAIERDSEVSAEMGLRISRALQIPLEILLDMDTAKTNDSAEESVNHRLSLYHKYRAVINTLESLSAEKQRAALTVMEQCGILGK